MDNLPLTFWELRGCADVNEIPLEYIENMFWADLTVPVLEGNAHDGGEASWKCLAANLPEVAALAVTFHARQKAFKLQAQVARILENVQQAFLPSL